ncbi:hypothetical protein A5785_03340 [Gordonia sp. 852002-50395_SCH5434458]|uniref:Uncharacterized protein n=1 Tax=Gordonia jacobaea TaxID=122202 RepID=A0ABR5IGI8_9ACTN|nr:hypothetical protein ABW18_05335 [Gordonia jacobaea]OBC09903.1 hypothetical protein A5785_03340 [Gordonia sp. 852002-50395_SCH5434458]
MVSTGSTSGGGSTGDGVVSTSSTSGARLDQRCRLDRRRAARPAGGLDRLDQRVQLDQRV